MPNKPSQQCGKQGLVTDRLKSLNANPKKSNMNAEQDAFEIWSKAGSSGLKKYNAGQKEHKTQFWTAGAGWYAENLRDEQLDLISYNHHLIERLKSMQTLAEMMEDEEVSLRDAAIILKELSSSHPPKPYSHQSND